MKDKSIEEIEKELDKAVEEADDVEMRYKETDLAISERYRFLQGVQKAQEEILKIVEDELLYRKDVIHNVDECECCENTHNHGFKIVDKIKQLRTENHSQKSKTVEDSTSSKTLHDGTSDTLNKEGSVNNC